MTEDKTRPILLTYRSVEQVVVEPEDQDRFVTTVQDAARACKSAQAGSEWQTQFEQFLSRIHEWCKGFAVVESSFVDVGDGGLRVSICTTNEDFDFDFEDEITELDIALAREFPNCLSEVTQIPRPVRARLDLSGAIMTYGDARTASSSS
jgi:hypothetical protein